MQVIQCVWVVVKLRHEETSGGWGWLDDCKKPGGDYKRKKEPLH